MITRRLGFPCSFKDPSESHNITRISEKNVLGANSPYPRYCKVINGCGDLTLTLTT